MKSKQYTHAMHAILALAALVLVWGVLWWR